MGIHSNKKSAQILSGALQAAQIQDIVISPGSRNAALIIEMTNQDYFNNYSVVDERSAAFFALGIAQQTNKPVVLMCTSGSAVLNYHPAVAEAFYSRIPLIVVSADRPKKWIDQGEGQTVRQDRVLNNHTYFSVSLLGDEFENADDFNQKQIEKAIKIAVEKQATVHINMPFDEPLYEMENIEDKEIIPKKFDVEDKIYEESFLQNFEKLWNKRAKKMILVGQHQASEFLQLQLEKLSEDPSVVILSENISNVKHDRFINNIDQVIFNFSDKKMDALQPDILLTVGRNIISKKIKQFLRKNKPKQHWHIEKTEIPPNTFEALTQHFDTSPEMFFSQFLFLAKPNNQSEYRDKFLEIKHKNKSLHTAYLSKIGFSDLKIFEVLSQNIPANFMVQWANSSTIRYAQLFDFHTDIIHFSNRGTSGIDGSTSTSIGAAYASQKPVLLVTGDISFFYDSNALWNKYIPDNFKILIINNGGGDIFNFIPGPSKTKALDAFFVTKHAYKTKQLANMYGFDYTLIKSLKDFEKQLISFLNRHDKPQIMEVDTSKINNHLVLKEYFKQF